MNSLKEIKEPTITLNLLSTLNHLNLTDMTLQVNPVKVKAFFITSIAPRSKDNLQQTAVLSWLRCPFIKVVSVNSDQEIYKFTTDPELKLMYNDILNHPNFQFQRVDFQPFENRYYVPISSCVDVAIQQLKDNNTNTTSTIESKISTTECAWTTACLINSDIIFGKPDQNIKELESIVDSVIQKQQKDNVGLVYYRRYDFHNFSSVRRCEGGIDTFFLSLRALEKIPKTIQFRMGLPWWDWFIPRFLITCSVKVIEMVDPGFYHKLHDVRWSKNHWSYFYKEYQKYITSHDPDREHFIILKTVTIQGQRRNSEDVSTRKKSTPVRRKRIIVARVPNFTGGSMIRIRTSTSIRPTAITRPRNSKFALHKQHRFIIRSTARRSTPAALSSFSRMPVRYQSLLFRMSSRKGRK